MVNEREIVLDSLLEILEKGQFMHLVINDVLNKYDYLDANKKGFIKRCISGTVENLIAIDEVIDTYASTKVKKQKPLIRTLLRFSTYQIVYMDKVPARAVCNEAVKLAGKRGFRTLSGFVNGVLRNISANVQNVNTGGDNVPDWIKEHLVNSYGEEKTRLILKDINEEHLLTVRVRNEKCLDERFVKSDFAEDIYYIKKGNAIKELTGYDDGAFVVQDASSILAIKNVGIKPGDFVMDICAAPGGKSIYAYDLGANVCSRDVSFKKTDLINKNMKRCGIPDADHFMETEVFDATVHDAKKESSCDVLIMDVPCSGLGVMGRKSDIRYRINKEDLESLSVLQRQIIDASWNYVKEGGTLLYSTCTMNPKENEEQVKYITSKYPFRVEKEKQFLPGIDKTDGFYFAVLKRL